MQSPDELRAAPASSGRFERSPAGPVHASHLRRSFASTLVFALALLLALIANRTSSAAEFAKNLAGECGRGIYTMGVAVDAAGNQYVTGYFAGGTVTLGGVTLTGIGPQDAFVAKLDPFGNAIWLRGIGGTAAMTFGTSIAVDDSGNIYLSGYFNGSDLTTPVLSLRGNEDAFAAKLDVSGNIIWARNFGGGGAWAEGQSVATDGIGNVFLTGQFRSANMAAPPLAIMGDSDAFVIKLDATGTTIWTGHFGGNGARVYGQAIAVDGLGNAYVGGYLTANLTAPPLTKIGDLDAFAIKLDASGAVIWAANFGGSGATAIGTSIAVDAASHVVLGGYFSVGNLTTPTLTRIGAQDAFAVRLVATTGAIVWAKNFGGSAVQMSGPGVAVGPSGDIFLSGSYFGGNLTAPVLPAIGVIDAFAIRLDPLTGNVVWARGFGGTYARVFGQAIAVDAGANVFLGRFFDGQLTNPALPTFDDDFGLILKLDSAGTVKSTTIFWSLSPCGISTINSTSVDASGNVYVTGTFGSAKLILSNLTLYRLGYQDSFVAKFDATGNPIWAIGLGGRWAGTNAQAIAFDGSGNVSVGGYFDSADLTVPSLFRIGIVDAFAVKLDAATGTMKWAKNFGGTNARTFGQGIAADPSGEVYLGGYFWAGDLTVPVLVKSGYLDAFAFKLDAASGAATWARDFGGNGFGYVFGQTIAADGVGNVYLGGYFDSSIATVPPLTAIGAATGFALKLDSTGTTTWAKNFGGPNAYADVQAIAVDGSGSVNLSGYFWQGNLSSPPLSLIGNVDAYAVKLGATGTTTWARNFGGSGAQVGRSVVAIDKSGNVYVGGHSAGAALTTPPLAKIGPDDAFAIKLDSSGTTKWARNYGGTDAWAHFYGIAAGDGGEVYLGGDMRINNLTMPPLTLVGDIDALIFGQMYYALTYDGNGNSGGIVPTDLTAYASGQPALIASNTGGLAKSGSVFAGWDTAADGTGTHVNPGDALPFTSTDVTLYARWVVPGSSPILLSAASRKTHGAAGNYDLPLSLADVHNPVTEPRTGPSHTIVFTFDMPVTSANAAVTNGLATAGSLMISGNAVIVDLAAVSDRQYLTVSLNNVTSGAATGGSGSVRVGFLAGDVNQSRVISIADLGLVNAQLAQTVTLSNFLRDINASGSITLADKGITNANLTKALPPP